ncbi:MAG TPA: methionyl-tRNA formyltransferase [Polyangia bacterium]|jgi:methionyl-tRNA formyltransferase|nr:methionyl-tRNA formyltransferase [Polyangia bacterium]
MSKLRVVFMGSPEFAVPCLEALLATEEVIAVVTQPDKPAGRGLGMQAPAVKVRALAAGLPVLQPQSVRKPPFVDELAPLAPDLCVVVAYGKILPAGLLALPRLGCLNVHASLLPKYRGAAPIQWAIIRGERETGVTLMRMDVGMDTGDMLATGRLPIDDDVTSGELHERLSRLGASVLTDGLARLKADALPATPQDPAQATMAPMLTKETGRVDFAAGARAVRDLVRGCDPWPHAYTTVDGQPLKLFRAKVVSGRGEPGVVLGADRDGLLVGCGDDAVAFAELQLPGKKRMPAQALLAGRAIPTGTRLGGDASGVGATAAGNAGEG